MLGALITRAQERGLGFSRLVSVGNECDIGVGELVHLLVDDPRTHAILLFLEAFRDADVLAAAARRAYDARKPIIALKLGRSPIGRAVAATHTGALASGDDVDRAFFREHAIIRVEVLEALFETAQLVLGARPPTSGRVAVLTVSGGGAAMIVDRLGVAGVEVVPPPAALVARLAAQKIRIAHGALIDLPMGRADHGAYAAILAELMASDHCDVVVAVQGSAAAFTPEVVRERILAAKRASKPLAVFIPPRAGPALDLLQTAGVAAFRTPEACADAVRAYCEWRAPAAAMQVADAARDRVCRAVRDAGRGNRDVQDALRMLSAIGVACAPSQVIRSGRERVELPFPVAVKILARDISHKSDVGGVALDVPDPQALEQAAERIIERIRVTAPHARGTGLLVQTMERGLAEVIVGYRRDRDVGPLIMVGVGGTFTEVWTGHAVRLAPVGTAAALEMIGQVPGLASIRGFRNRQSGDLHALAHVIHTLSLLALAESPRVLEAEINPLVVRERGTIAVDARISIEAE
jgi:acyl-CoA synthetase (NDP forming)